jgi:hypothetical protein
LSNSITERNGVDRKLEIEKARTRLVDEQKRKKKEKKGKVL